VQVGDRLAASTNFAVDIHMFNNRVADHVVRCVDVTRSAQMQCCRCPPTSAATGSNGHSRSGGHLADGAGMPERFASSHAASEPVWAQDPGATWNVGAARRPPIWCASSCLTVCPAREGMPLPAVGAQVQVGSAHPVPRTRSIDFFTGASSGGIHGSDSPAERPQRASDSWQLANKTRSGDDVSSGGRAGDDGAGNFSSIFDSSNSSKLVAGGFAFSTAAIGSSAVSPAAVARFLGNDFRWLVAALIAAGVDEVAVFVGAALSVEKGQRDSTNRPTVSRTPESRGMTVARQAGKSVRHTRATDPPPVDLARWVPVLALSRIRLNQPSPRTIHTLTVAP
jgi:hypothetical protein